MGVKVIVREKFTRKGIPLVSVRIESGGFSSADCTNNMGMAEFDDIPDGKYVMKIRHKDYRPYTEKMFISRNSIINIKLHKAFD